MGHRIRQAAYLLSTAGEPTVARDREALVGQGGGDVHSSRDKVEQQDSGIP